MRPELAQDMYRVVVASEKPAHYGVSGHLWKHQNGYWYVLYGPELKRRVSTRSQDRVLAEEFLRKFFICRDWLIVTRRKLF